MDTKLPTLIDNTADNTVLDALKQVLAKASAWDIATGYFEIGALLALDGFWQPLKNVRLLMGDETTRRTREQLVEALRTRSEDSIESAKERDDALSGLAAIRAALQNQQIEARVYSRAKFHAKAYLFHTQPQQLFNVAIAGSSNFTVPGLTENMELNLLTSDALQFNALKAWYEQRWGEAEPVREELLRVIERHLRAYAPFEVWAKSLYEYFAGKEKPATHWDTHESVVYPLLSKYQQDGYRTALQIAERWGGAFICDGVGLGKTYIGAMLLEYHLHRGDRILLIVPKSVRKSVWESDRQNDPMRLVRERYRRAYREMVEIRHHTDFGREGTVSDEDFAYYRDFYPVIIIDEAHHFRTPSARRSKALKALCVGKRMYFLTATPINNSLLDLYHLINYIAYDRQNHFAPLGIHHLRRYFGGAEERLEAMMQNSADIQTALQDADLLRTDGLLKELVIQRSRAYVKASEQHALDLTPLPPLHKLVERGRGAGGGEGEVDGMPLFPEREKPKVVTYSLRKVYADIYDDLKAAFGRETPLLSLAMYNPEPFRKGDPDSELLNRDKQVIGLIRTLLLKRLESSYKAFEASLEELLRKMAGFLAHHAEERWEAWRKAYEQEWRIVHQHQREQWEGEAPAEPAEVEEANEFDDIEIRPLEPENYKLPQLLSQVEADMTLLVMLLSDVYQHLSPETDDKLQQLVTALRDDPTLKDKKVVIFTEFRSTARYLFKQLRDGYGFTSLEELDSTRKVDREVVIKRFAPYYNCAEEELPSYLKNEIRILITTDVLSEGLNLQDATNIVNYDLHWNPVRLMQRIGRVDRRLNMEIERKLGREAQHPLKIHVYNFLPPSEMDDLLHLFQRVAGKLLRISKTLGIEAPILTPEDDYEALRLFNEKYEGQQSIEERLYLELEQLRKEHPGLFVELPNFPRRIFSGECAPDAKTRGL
ncbi:hypothetical protein HYR99_40035, partial [Candidatus Poribacteria bacterium]|nr:hypothetical protein [Candidatus Poribacteria bacterium]